MSLGDAYYSGWSGAIEIFSRGDVASSGSVVRNTNRYANFAASRCSSIYGRSNTITPLSVSCKFYIKY